MSYCVQIPLVPQKGGTTYKMCQIKAGSLHLKYIRISFQAHCGGVCLHNVLFLLLFHFVYSFLESTLCLWLEKCNTNKVIMIIIKSALRKTSYL